MEYLIRFVQMHETFRQPEVESIAELIGFPIRWVKYSDDSPFAIIAVDNEEDSIPKLRALSQRAILIIKIYELWGHAQDMDGLHTNVKQRTQDLWPSYMEKSFRFDIDAYQGSHSNEQKRQIIESFRYMAFTGPIVMSTPDEKFTVFEDYVLNAKEPYQVLFGRQLSEGGRKASARYSLKKRQYIATTSMDAELSLVTANMALAAPGKLAYDPFMGTGSFPVSCAYFGAAVFGSDLDGRSIRGKQGRNVESNFKQYGTSSLYFGGFAADITNTPLHSGRFLDAIVCDPPYGVREGLKVLGNVKDKLKQEVILNDGSVAHLQPDYVPPKRPYSFVRMMDDILDFGAVRLVDNGRLCMWVPVAGAREDPEATPEELEKRGEEGDAEEYEIPRHPAMELVAESTQQFNKWSRRLLTYKRKNEIDIDLDELSSYSLERLKIQESETVDENARASDLNSFRKKYFEGFKSPLIKQFHGEG